MFTAKPDCGLPIGNLTSQVFANFYLTEFDHFIKHELGIKNYVRYVDDFVIVHESKSYLKYLIPKIRKFLSKNLKLTLHPKKIYLQPATRGVLFLGVFIKPNYMVSGKRIINNFNQKLIKYEKEAELEKPNKEKKNEILSSVNSYLGIMRHYKTWKVRTKMLKKHFMSKLQKHFKIKNEALKLERNKGRMYN